jgi:cAMP phosphodiesterase
VRKREKYSNNSMDAWKNKHVILSHQKPVQKKRNYTKKEKNRKIEKIIISISLPNLESKEELVPHLIPTDIFAVVFV